jgi:hypothetical protein
MADVRYVFTASGHESVERAFIGIEQAARKSSRGVERAYEGQEKAARRSASVQESAARRPASRLEQLARQVERDQIRAAQREARAKTQALQHVQRIRDRHFADEQRKEERSLQVKSRTEQRIAKERERSMAYVARIRDKHFADEERRHQQGVRSAVRAGEAKGRAQHRLEQQFRERTQRGRSGTLGRIGGEMKGAALGGAAAIGALGVGVGGAAVKDAYALQSAANRISINSRKSGEKFIDATTLRKEFEATALASGGTVKGEQVADAVSRYITMTGDIKSARQLQGTFATVATATDADIGAVAETAAAISEQFKINGIEEFRESLALLVAQGKSGAFELKDAATQYQRLAASAGSFNIGTGVEAVKTLGGLTQIARSATGSPESAATAVENLFTNLKLKADDLAGEDVDIYTRDKKGNATGTRKVQDIIADMVQKVGGSDIDVKNEKLAKYLGEQGIRSVNPLIAEFTRTFHDTKGNEKAKSAAGRTAVEAMIQRFTNVPGSWQDVEVDAQQAKAGPGAKFSAMWDKVTAAAGEKLLPVLDRMLDTFEVTEGAVDTFVGTLEVLLEMLQAFGQAMGILKNPMENKEYRKRQEENRIKKIDKQISELPSEEKAMALAATGDLQGAMEIGAKINSPEVILQQGRLNNDKALAQSRIAALNNVEKSLGTSEAVGYNAKSAGGFAEAYLGMGASGDTPQARERAQMIAKALASKPMESIFSNESMLDGENADQRAARLGFARSVAEQKIQHGGKADEAGAQVAATGLAAILERITKSAAPAAAALEKMGQAAQPSISSG